MNSPYEVIIRPIVTERSFDLMEQGKYTFEVAKTAGKEEIAEAVEKLFGVHVVKVNTMQVKGKHKRVRYQTMGMTRSWKKAIVTLKAGETIEIFGNQQVAAEYGNPPAPRKRGRASMPRTMDTRGTVVHPASSRQGASLIP